MEVEDRTCSVPRPCLLRRRLQMMGILSIKKRHRHRLSIQSVFPGLPNTLLIRNKPPAIEIEKRSKVFEPLNLRLELRKRARPRRGGLSGTGEDGWILIIELGADRREEDSDLTGDSSLARAFESKHGHLQLRGSSRSSIEEPGQWPRRKDRGRPTTGTLASGPRQVEEGGTSFFFFLIPFPLSLKGQGFLLDTEEEHWTHVSCVSKKKDNGRLGPYHQLACQSTEKLIPRRLRKRGQVRYMPNLSIRLKASLRNLNSLDERRLGFLNES
ncbi:hypothetical protein ACOSQ2_003181 [Xanthoceras sorbifolium]